MVQPKSFVEELESDEPSLGIILKSMSPMMAEALGYTDLSYLFIDFQHGVPVISDIDQIVRAADLNDLPIVVRVPREDLSMITYLLDMGVRGIILPQVEGPDIVREASSHMRYSDGRSIASRSRAAKFGEIETEDYINYVNNEIALIPMIETEEGVENASQIARQREATALLIGTGDLSLSLGVEMKSEHLKHTVDRIFQVGAENNLPVGLPARSLEDIDIYSKDASFLLYGTDVGHTKETVNDMLEIARFQD